MTFTRTLAACLGLQLRRAARLLPALLAMALAAVLLAAGAAAAGGALLAGRGFAGVTLAVAAEDGDERIASIAGTLAGIEEISGFATVTVVAADEAEQLVRRRDAAAAILLPAGFWDSLMTGENRSPRLLVDSSRPLEMMLVTRLAESAAGMLTRAQQGIGFTLELYDARRPEGLTRGQAALDINLAYAGWVLGHGAMVRTVTVSATRALSVSRHYLLAALLLFAALSLPVLYRLYAGEAQRGWLARLRGAGCPPEAWALGQVGAGALAMLAMLAVLAAGVWLAGGRPTPGLAALPGLLLCALALSCFGHLCCNAGGVLAASGLNFLITLAGLVTFGGLVPLVLLPAPVAALAPFSPMGWMHRALAPLLGAPADPAALGLVALLCAALLGLCLLAARRRERRGAL